MLFRSIPRTTNESMFTSSPGFDPNIIPMPYVMSGKRGAPAKNEAIYDLELRRAIDSQLVERSIAFIQQQQAAGKPFFTYVPLTQLHYPTIPHHDFAGQSGAGDFADAMMEMDHRTGQLVDFIDQSGLRENTVFIFASDNGPEFRRPWRGTAGPWSGTYHTAMEGALRVPFIVRWPDHVPANRVSNEIVHVTDLYTTLEIGRAHV